MLLEEVFELLAASFATANQLEAAKRAVFDAINFRLITFKPEKFFDALEDIDYIVEGTRVEAGIKGMSLFTEVHRANMTKAVPCAVCSGTGRQADMQTLVEEACAPCKGLGRVIIKSETGKVLKPDGWTPPDIAGELRVQGYPGL